MRVRILIFGELSHHLSRSLSLKLEEGATVRSIIRLLSERAGRNIEGFTVLVNGRNIELLRGLETELMDGDLVVLLPPLSGG